MNKRKNYKRSFSTNCVQLTQCRTSKTKETSTSTKTINGKSEIVKESSHVIMFVGLQGAGKTRHVPNWLSIIRRGFKVGLVCRYFQSWCF